MCRVFQVNFQFDTTFMYVISVLVFLKVYQFRHPDITSEAHVVFSIIGLALFAEVLIITVAIKVTFLNELAQVVGYYYDNYWFWALFILGYLVVLIAFISHTYFNGMYR